LRQTRTRTRRPSVWALAALFLTSGCGGGGGESAPPPPAIAPAAAERLAATSDSIADLLDAGDVCGAAGRADELLAQTIEAINAGDVPPRFHEQLSAKANELVNEVNCPEPVTTTDEDEEADEDENGTKKEKKERKDKEDDNGDDGDDDPPITLPVPTPTETTP
jgi:hypothetical protein